MRIEAGTDLGMRTKVYDRDGNLVPRAVWLDTDTHQVKEIEVDENGKVVVKETHTDDDHVTHFEPVEHTWATEGWTYRIDGGDPQSI